jgi:hypothetical protein
MNQTGACTEITDGYKYFAMLQKDSWMVSVICYQIKLFHQQKEIQLGASTSLDGGSSTIIHSFIIQ